MNGLRVFLLTVAMVLTPMAAWSATTTFGALKDNTIFENMPNNSGGGTAGIFSGANNLPSKRRGFIAFDILKSDTNPGGVPAGSIITGAELSMYLANAPNPNSQTIGLHRMLFDWGENINDTSSPAVGGAGNGVAAAAGDATWNESFFGTTTWSSLGGSIGPGAAGAFSSTASVSTTVSGPIDNQHKWLSTAGLISDVQSWLDNPSSNFGWAIINANETSTQTMKAFYSRQATVNTGGSGTTINPTWRPMLIITYVPEPGTEVLILVAGSLLYVVRRRLTDPLPSSSGDYNGNGIVDAVDYIVWRNTYGESATPAGSRADGNEGQRRQWRLRQLASRIWKFDRRFHGHRSSARTGMSCYVHFSRFAGVLTAATLS
jgi:hypothetical protein